MASRRWCAVDLNLGLNFTPLPFASSLPWPVCSRTSAVAQTVVSAIHDRCLTENGSCLGIPQATAGEKHCFFRRFHALA
jgi:hypothetical protein